MKPDLIGTSYGRLTIMEDLGVHNKNRKVLCNCECGNTCEVFVCNLKKGNTTSCGCLLKTLQKTKWEDIYKERGFTAKNQATPEYLAWRNMNSRCYNEKDISYKNYGGKGVVVCEEWRDSFEQFLQDVGHKPEPFYSLDRTDVNVGYIKGNVSWKDLSWQARNKGKQKGCNSKFKGVSFEAGKWRARIRNSEGVSISLGMYDNESLAAKAVDNFLVKEFGETCPWTNEKLKLFDSVEDINDEIKENPPN